MTKQDMSGVRTAQDLERKYDLSSIAGLKKNYELQKNNLTKVENELNDFVKVTTKNLEDIQNQVDGNITTWFSSGIPTIENYPTNEWSTNTDKNNHLGDLYYDQDTGYAYRFALENNIYSWLKITDNDVTEALALANSAKDTADRKRQVFVSQPIPPYDVGDLWIKDEEIYRCQTSRPSGETFEDNDWIKATKYTDDTVANQVDGKLTIVSGTVTEIKDNVDELKTTMTNTTKLVDEHGNTIGTLQEKQSETTQTVNEITTKVSTVENSLTKTNSDLSDLSGTVDTLNKDVQGVSADFEDFKDNEYVQSIDNLQKQIDGSIQFWNGAEIPTLENYPANEWTTENDKINHQADIYTVVQDVEGEMKQGKSYRFDKINGVWQWIELTDNELSAVQALAQEALDKAKANADEIKSSVSEVTANLNNNYTTNQELNQLMEEQKAGIQKEMSTTITQTKSEVETSILTKINEDGVEKVKNTLVTINQDGVNVAKSDEDVQTLLSNTGVYTSDGIIKSNNSNVLMKVDRSGAYFKTQETVGTIKENDCIQKEKINHEKYGVCQAWYWIGG